MSSDKAKSNIYLLTKCIIYSQLEFVKLKGNIDCIKITIPELKRDKHFELKKEISISIYQLQNGLRLTLNTNNGASILHNEKATKLIHLVIHHVKSKYNLSLSQIYFTWERDKRIDMLYAIPDKTNIITSKMVLKKWLKENTEHSDTKIGRLIDAEHP